MSSAQLTGVAKTRQTAGFAHVAIVKTDAISTALRVPPVSRDLFHKIPVNQSRVVSEQAADALMQGSTV